MHRKSFTKAASREVLKLAEGLFAHAVDYGLWMTIYFSAMSVPQSQWGQLWRAQREADRFLNEVNYDVIKHAIQTARKRGWIKIIKRNAPPAITQEGKKRLESIIPRYDEKRVWDGRMHLVTYDVPESQKRDREMFRRYLKAIGCGMLQESVWLTPYNPIDTLRAFIDEKRLRGNIIVSDLGKDGSIGEEDARSMIVRIYKLEAINDRYIQWLNIIEENGEDDHLAILQYLAILKDDPQLPFSLLPPWWKGNQVYKSVKCTLQKVVDILATAQTSTV